MIQFVKEFDYIKIKLASPLRILQWANRRLPNGQFVGEVQKSETINYRTFKPEMDGLFCERIFGPSKSLECACGKYKRVRYEGLICERCGVELTESRVRRHRMGYINLIYPVAHVWYINSRPNFLALLLEVEDSEKTFNTAFTVYSERCTRCGYLKPTTSTIVELWDERIKRIKLASIAYFIAEDEISFYGLHWDLQQYRYFRLIGATDYPLKPYPKPQSRRYSTPKYLLRATPNFLIGAPLIKRELERLNLKTEIYRTRLFVSDCTETLNKKSPHYDFSQWFRKWEQQRLYKLREQAIKRIRILENLVGTGANPAWMILTILPVIPPALRPMIQLEGGRFATSDLNELYRRIITRNNRLLRLLEIDAPQLIIRNEKRMLQEAVDTLIDNGKRGKIALSANNRPLKSLSDIIKGKYGRFRQNLLGKRVDYSGRSVIVVGPTLKLNQCGLPYEMALELFQPFIIRELINQGLASNMKIAKNLIQQNEPIIDPVLEKVLTNHPIFLNRAPTLHRLGIQAFEPILIQGRAIKLHPLVCTAFNADFDGDQMAVHLPLGPEAILECQLLMLASHNILNPANGSPIAVPSQDMVLGLYYMTKLRRSEPGHVVKGEGLTFYGPEELVIAFNEKRVDINAPVKCRISLLQEDGSYKTEIIETTAGRVIFNQKVPDEAGYINEVLTKKALRDIIGDILKVTDVPRTAAFLDEIKDLGYGFAFRGGLSFSLGDIMIPKEKQSMIDTANSKVDGIRGNYGMGLITQNERYNQVIDVWTKTNAELTELSMKNIREDQQGFNSVYMMLDSGARGSKEQIRQLTGMRGLMAKPKKSNDGGGAIIENPILSNFKEGLSILEYFISTHGARKGLADTALKTADAGYLTRRLHDVAQDVIVNHEDCETLRGIDVAALKKNEEVMEKLGARVLGRTALHDVIDPATQQVIVAAGELIVEEIADIIEASELESVEVRSALTCEAAKGVCTKCYGRNLATNRLVMRGEAVGVIAAQSIGEPGTQLTLRTFHVGGVASTLSQDSSITAKNDGILEIEDLKTVTSEGADGKPVDVVISRTAESKLLHEKTGMLLNSNNIPYGCELYAKPGTKVKKGDLLAKWDPFNGVIISEFAGKIKFENIIQGVTFLVESDEQTGYEEKVISDSRDKKLIPTLHILDSKGDHVISYNLPVGAHLMVNDEEKIKVGKVLVKIPRKSAKAGDITGGLPRVTELFEARNPSNPAVVSEIDGVVSFGKIKRGNREIVVTSKTDEIKKYLVKLSNQILVQENDYVRAGMPLSDGSITPKDILAIKGPSAVQQYLVNEVQEVYRLQGVKINDKHFEVVVRQMMRKVRIVDSGDGMFLENQLVHKEDFILENDRLYGKKVVESSGDSANLKEGQIVTSRELRDENSILRREDKALATARDVMPATAEPVLQGITRASLQTKSFISAASFQETTKVLNEAAVAGKVDTLEGLKENVIVGHRIPAGTGMRNYEDIIVGSKEEFENLLHKKEEPKVNYN